MDVVSSQRNILRRSSSSAMATEDQNDTDAPRKAGTLEMRLRRARSSSAPPLSGRNKLIEEHYRVDTKEKVVLPGLPKHEDDWARDLHDFFNLIVLVPVVVLNVINWNWDMLLNMPPNKDIEDAWTGDWFTPFFRVAVLYFLTDLAWICIFPNCVRSPATIIQHHIATLLYLYVPFSVPHTRWCMGACMSVEVNTWFLIARRVFNKQGFSPWVIGLPPFLSIRVKLVSIFFYLTWISVRCILYPYLLMEFTQLWIDHSEAVGTRLNVLAIVTPLHAIFCILNARWTYELIMSKVRYWRRKGPGKKYSPSKGL